MTRSGHPGLDGSTEGPCRGGAPKPIAAAVVAGESGNPPECRTIVIN
jgi:hypothetical protein